MSVRRNPAVLVCRDHGGQGRVEGGEVKQTANELLDAVRKIEGYRVHSVTHDLAARVEKVLALHVEERTYEGGPADIFVCEHCRKNWPCPTIRLLDGGNS